MNPVRVNRFDQANSGALSQFEAVDPQMPSNMRDDVRTDRALERVHPARHRTGHPVVPLPVSAR
jgi:hypothetical protein